MLLNTLEMWKYDNTHWCISDKSLLSTVVIYGNLHFAYKAQSVHGQQEML